MDPTTLRTLAAFPEHLEAHYTAIPDGFKHWVPPSWEGIPSEPFSAIEQICHVRDIEIDGYHERFRRALQETDPVLASIDGEALARQRCYAGADASEVFAVFRAARAETVRLISGLGQEQFARMAVFEDRPASVRSLVHYLCSHDQQHLAGLQWLLGRIEASACAIRLQSALPTSNSSVKR
jgi:DinB family protein